MNFATVETPRTVSDTKKAFYTAHTRPIHSIFRRFIEELLVEIHLLRVNVDFHYTPLFALGVVTAFEKFMADYRPEGDRPSIFTALCHAEELDPDQLQRDASSWQTYQGQSLDHLLDQLNQGESSPLAAVAHHPGKYNRLTAIGLYALIDLINPEMISDVGQLNAGLEQLCPPLNLPTEKVKKDLELYRSNLEKMVQARKLLTEVAALDRKRRSQAESPLSAAVDTNSDTPAST
ncbi:photosystem II biogenesis protein Psp29 [Candidatus Synechococcus calcipolaris G9]|uniref:Protein Thf1 n=1 Tax=Candidatus Synechococcus calcipolaris G9 TaxID=1497997 RepID=A0ABT6EZJ3_9SYNE|nr:photosystem II biogenesis protein Psp29 [Candidatus Synechococcus calcipolaris G9]